MRFVLVIFSLFFCGCAVWPTLTRPEVQFRVVDEKNSPVSEAHLKFVTMRNPHSRKVNTKNFVADSKGLVKVSSERAWEYKNFIFPHGVKYYHWNYCASAAGYASKAGQITLNDPPTDEVVIPLTKSNKKSQCDKDLRILN